MSRPRSSVPHQRERLGGSSRAGRLIWAGSCGASHGANIAHRTKAITSSTPAVANGLWRAMRGSEIALVDILENPLTAKLAKANRISSRPSRQVLATFAVKGFSLPYPRIHRGIQQVGQKIHGHVRQPNRQDAPLHEIVVAIRNSLHCESAHAGPGKNCLGHNRAREQRPKLQASTVITGIM